MQSSFRHILSTVLLVSALTISSSAQLPATPLEFAKPIERELKAGESVVFEFKADAQNFIHVLVEQMGIDVVVSLLDGTGRTLLEVDGPTGSQGRERINFIQEREGTVRIKIGALDADAQPGKFSITLRELRPFAETDRSLIAGERLENEARLLADEVSSQSLRRFEKLANEAMENYISAAKGPDASGQIEVRMNNLSLLLANRGDYVNALRLHREQLLLLERYPERLSPLGRANNNIGLIFQKQGNTHLALEYMERALGYWEKAKDANGVSMVLNNIGIVYMNTGKHSSALDMFRRSVNAKSDDEVTDTDVLANIGLVYMNLKEFDKALKYLQKSFSLTKEQDAHIAADMAKVYRLIPNYEKSMEWARRSLALLQADETQLLAVANTLAAQAAFPLGRYDEALSFADAAITQNEKLKPAGRLEDGQELFERSLEPYYIKAEVLAVRGKAADALAVYERVRSKALIDVLRNGRAERDANSAISERNKLAVLDQEITRLNSALVSERQKKDANKTVIEEFDRKLTKSRGERDAFEARMSASVRRPTPSAEESAQFDLGNSTSIIDEKTLVLEYMVGDYGKTMLFAVSKTTRDAAPSIEVFILDDRENEVPGIDVIRQYRAAVEKGELGFSDNAKELYRRLIKPAESLLTGKSKVVVVPDAALWDLPFQALTDDKGVSLVEKVAISYAPSLTALKEMSRMKARNTRERATRLLAFGNPVVASSTAARSKQVLMSAGLGPIPEAERLVTELGRMYGPTRSKILIGAEAREEIAKKESPSYRIVQFATHGILNDAAPMYSHLVLALGHEGSKEDGLLEAWELKNLNLSADMVILSACDTARGSITSGEGIIGMTWAAFIAGTPTTVASQWKVESSSTTEFMLEFHRQMLANKKISKAEALRRASLKLMRSAKYRHPSYWAPWVLIGDGS